LQQEYEKAINHLTINEENRLRRTVEILKIEKSKLETIAKDVAFLKRKYNKLKVWQNPTLTCVCGHDREDHQHLLGTKLRYPCLKCPCPSFRKRLKSYRNVLLFDYYITLRVGMLADLC